MSYRLSVFGCVVATLVASSGFRAPNVVISIDKFAFAPAEITVAPGDTVIWSNEDVFQHTTSADSGAWSSPLLRRGERFTFIANRAGRYVYHCTAHPVMSGVLVVRE